MVVWVNGVKQIGEMPAGRGPAVIHSLSYQERYRRGRFSSCSKATVPSRAGVRHRPPTRPARSAAATSESDHGRVQVKPPFVEQLTQTPLVSSVRLKLICE